MYHDLINYKQLEKELLDAGWEKIEEFFYRPETGKVTLFRALYIKRKEEEQHESSFKVVIVMLIICVVLFFIGLALSGDLNVIKF